MACRCGSGVVSVLVRIAALAGVGIFIGGVHSTRVRLIAPPPKQLEAPPAPPVPEGVTAPLGPRLSLAEAKRLFDEGAPFIDARPDHEHVRGTIPGSFHITPGSFSTAQTGNMLVFIDQDKPVIIYCGGGDCHDSDNLAALLRDAGYKSLHVFTDGFPAWQAAGYEVDVPALPTPAGGG